MNFHFASMHRTPAYPPRTSAGVSLFFLIPLLLVLACKTPGTGTGSQDKPGKKLSQAEQIQLTALFIDANREKALGNDDKAMGLFAQCVKRDPTYAPAMYEMARVFEQRNQLPEALVMASSAVKYEEDNEWYQLLLAGIYIKMRDYQEASRVLKLLAEKNPGTPDYLMDLANVFILAGKNGDAIKVYDDIEKKFGINEETSLQKERLYLQSGKVNKAIDELESLVKAFPGEMKYKGMLAELYLQSGNDLRGLDLYEQMIKTNPQDPYIHLSLSEYYRSKGNESKAFEELQLAFASPDLDIDNKIRILLRYFDRSENDEIVRADAYILCTLMLKANPQEAKAWSMAGDFYYRDRKFADAAAAFRNVIGLDSNKYVVWEQLMIINTELQDYESMERESRLAMQLFPEHAEMYLYNGFANIQKGRFTEAVQSLRAGLAFAFEKELILKMQINLGDALYSLGDFDGSFEAYEKALRVESGNLYVMNKYASGLALQKRNLSRAEELVKKLNSLVPDQPVYESSAARVYFALEKYTEALGWIEKSVAHGGSSNGSTLELYGDILFRMNRTDEALQYWMQALEKGGGSPLLNQKINDKNWYE